MIDDESKLNLEQDLPAVRSMAERAGGEIDESRAEDGIYWFDLVARDGQHYYMRVEWFSYPHDPPSVRFVSGIGVDSATKTDWPQCPGFRPDTNDICRAFTREGFNTHPEWRTTADAWSPNGNKFLDVVAEVQNDLTHRYAGRTA